MLFVVSLLPIVIYLVVIYNIDHFALVSMKRLALLVLGGMVAALVCFGLFRLMEGVLSDDQSDVVHPVMEEIVKTIPLFVLAWRKKIAFFIDSIICGAAVGGGFSILENLLYLTQGREMALGTGLFRGLEVALIHMGCSAIIAAGLMVAVRQMERVRLRQELKWSDIATTVSLLVAALAMHVGHNAFHFNPLLQFACVVAIFGGLLAWTYLYDIDMTHRWLDKGLDKQLSLMSAIKEGQVTDTPTGAFLKSIKELFPPEVYFDIICYVGLHTELSVAAKSRFMLREVGIDLPMEEKEKELNLSKFVELKELEKNIGKSAKMTIAPIVTSDPADVQAFNNLREECLAK